MGLKNEQSSGISTGEAALRAYGHLAGQLSGINQNMPNFSPLLKQVQAISSVLHKLGDAKNLERTAQTFNAVFSEKNMRKILQRLENLAKPGNSEQKQSTSYQNEVKENLRQLFSLTKSQIPKNLKKQLRGGGLKSDLQMNNLVNDSLYSVASQMNTLTPAHALDQIDTPLRTLSRSMESTAAASSAASVPLNSKTPSISRSYSALQSPGFSDVDRIATAVAEKMIQILEIYPRGSSSPANSAGSAVSSSESKDIENTAKNIERMTDDKTLNRLNDMKKTIYNVDKNIMASVTTISSISQALNAYSDAAIAHIQRQAQAALDNLAAIYSGSQGLITQAEEELQAFREAREAEEEERKLRKEEEEFAYQQEVYEKELHQLEAALSSEANIRNAKKLEAELEKKRTEKRRQQEKRAAEQAEKKRQEELDRQEEELLKAKQLREWEYEVQKTQIQNEVGQAKAQAERQAAIISKTTQTAQLTGQIAMTTAQAIINMANPMTLAIGIAQLAAAGSAAAQIGLIAATPLPPAYTPIAAPARPFAAGGIVPAIPHGLPIQFGAGRSGIIAEAGHDELVLPLTQMNIDKFLKPFAQSTQQTAFNYSPSISISIQGQKTPEETLAYIREHLQRDLFETVEEARSRFRLRSS